MDEEEEINFQDAEHVFHTFLRQHCENEVMEILNTENELEHYSIHINALELFDMNMLISTQLLKVPLQLLPVFERAAFKVIYFSFSGKDLSFTQFCYIFQE